MQQIVTFHKEEALLSINGSSSVQLRSLLEGVCDLVSVYELISKVDKSSDLQIILTQSIMDSCNWVTDNYYYCMFYTRNEYNYSMFKQCSLKYCTIYAVSLNFEMD